MLTRQRIVSYGIPTAAAATIVAAALLTTRSDPKTFEPVQTIPTHEVGDGTAIDVVFAVDTTGSMGGLLEGAKQTVWSIAKHIRQADPNANVRIGLVAYRDIGPHEAYVTRPFALTNDLDAVYSELTTYQAEGGGDTPEDVDAALNDALKMQWREGATKLVFVVGDAPPSSRGEVPTFDVLAAEAAERGIRVNTIRCGWDDQTAVAFERLAKLGNGEFSTIQQDGGVKQIATPYDNKIAELSTAYDGTAVIVGDEGTRGRYQAQMADAERAAPAAKADRAGYYAKGGDTMKRSDDDFVAGWASGATALPEAAELPADMRDKNKEELKVELDRRVEQRKKIQAELSDLTKQREDFLSKNQPAEGGFDAKVKQTVEKQMKR